MISKSRAHSIAPLALLAAVALLALAGCGSSDESSTGGAYGGKGGDASTSEATVTTPPNAEAAAVLTIASSPGVGPVLVQSEGFTVYDFHKDKGTTSSCYGPCEKIWPPVTTKTPPQTGEGANASLLDTTKRKDGTLQVTYAGHPLYTYAADKKPGEATGNDVDSFGAEWYALKANGEEAEG